MFKVTRCFLLLAALVLSAVAPKRNFAAGAITTNTAAYAPFIAAESNEGELAMKRFRVPKGFKVELVAAEPLLANPVAFCIDEQGRFYVAETFRLHTGVTDIRGHMDWLDEDLASRSVEERIAMMKRHEGKRISEYAKDSDRVRLLVDSDGDGRADKSTVFADGFSGLADGIGAGVLARKGSVYFANIPHLWLLQDKNGDGAAESKRSLHYGYGVRVGFIGHDLHGLCIGPDGKLYFSIGDRGAHVKLPGGKIVKNHESGAVYRCNLNGSNLEIFATGLRNPQELAFDQYGNLWTGENNSDGGDPARWVYLVEGGDSGWRIGFQFINQPNARGPWMSERMCYPEQDGQPAYILPPIANIGNGPSGLAYYPGVGLPGAYNGHFFLCDFRGGTGSGVHSFAVKPKGASFEVVDRTDFIWEVLVTDGDFGYDGAFYISDWVNGWAKPGKGRIYRITNAESAKGQETRKLFAEGFDQRPNAELKVLLSHGDMRVRQEAQFALAGRAEVETLAAVATNRESLLNRLHGIWGLGQIAVAKVDQRYAVVELLLPLCGDEEMEVRAQAAKVLGDLRATRAADALTKLLLDDEARPRFFAAIALGKIGRKQARGALLQMLRENDNRDRYLRHAGIVGLAGCADVPYLRELTQDISPAVRLAAVVALRRLERPEAAAYLNDKSPEVLLEAARAINDLPITRALPQLAEKIKDVTDLVRLMPTAANSVALVATDTKAQTDYLTPLLRRVVNANFRLGGVEHAQALANFAAADGAPESVRAEVLAMLAQWDKPSGRDAVTGLWRKLNERDPRMASGALEPKLPALLERQSAPIRVATLKAAGTLKVKSVRSFADELALNAKESNTVRVAALKALAALKAPELEGALKAALADSDQTLRREATQLQAVVKPGDSLGQLTSALESGGIPEKQSALIALGNITNAPPADVILLEWLDRLIAGEVPVELHVDLIEAAAKRTHRQVQEKLRKFESARPAEDDLRAFRECLVGGSKEAGRKIFLEKPEVSCVRCHKADGEGGEAGPDLSGIGKRQNRQYILESIVLPNKSIAAGFQSELVTTKGGAVYAGIVKQETDAVLVLNSPEDGLMELKKDDIKMRESAPSAMPEEFRQVLSKRELRDLVEFLAEL